MQCADTDTTLHHMTFCAHAHIKMDRHLASIDEQKELLAYSQ